MNSHILRTALCIGFALAQLARAQVPTVWLDSPPSNSVIIGNTSTDTFKITGWALDSGYLIDTNATCQTVNGPVTSAICIQADSQQTGYFSFGGGYGVPLAQASYTYYYSSAHRSDVCAGAPNAPNCLVQYPPPCGGTNQPACGSTGYVGFESDNYIGNFVPLPDAYSFRVSAKNTLGVTNSSNTNGPVWIEAPIIPLYSASPSSATGISQTFTFSGTSSTNYNATYNPGEVGMIWGLINTTQQDALTSPGPNGLASPTEGACFFQVVLTPLNGAIKYYAYLVTNNGTNWQPGVDITLGGTISNDQCSLSFQPPAQNQGFYFPVTITAQGLFVGQSLDVWMATFQEQLNSTSGWQDVGPAAWAVPGTVPDAQPNPYPNYLTLPTAATPACNITGNWNDTAALPGTLVWQITQPDTTVNGTAVSTGSGGSTTYQTVAGTVIGNTVTLVASNPNPAFDTNGQEFPATITAPVIFSSCYSGTAQEQWYYPPFVYDFQQIPANTASPVGTLTQPTQLTFRLSPSPYVLLSTGDTNVTITTTASSPQFQMSNVLYSLFSSDNPQSSCPAYPSFQTGSGTGLASSVVTASPAGCSGIFTVQAAVAGTLSLNNTQVVIPPQVLLQVLKGEAGGQARRYGPGDPTEQALGVTIRNRFGDPLFPGATTWQNTITTAQFNGIDASVTTGQDPPGSGTQSPELINASAIFGGTSTAYVANAKCFFSPTSGTDPLHPGWQQIQSALTSGSTTLPTADADPKCYRPPSGSTANEQFIYKQSISPNTNGSGAPAFIFVQWRKATDPAVIQIQ